MRTDSGAIMEAFDYEAVAREAPPLSQDEFAERARRLRDMLSTIGQEVREAATLAAELEGWAASDRCTFEPNGEALELFAAARRYCAALVARDG